MRPFRAHVLTATATPTPTTRATRKPAKPNEHGDDCRCVDCANDLWKGVKKPTRGAKKK